MSLVKGIHHVCMKCQGLEEFDKIVGFYRDILEMPEVRRWGSGDASAITLDTGCGLIEIFANGDDRHEQGAVRHFALETDDVDACVAKVQAAGYPITVNPKNVDLPSEPPYPIRVAFCLGPQGEEIEFFQIRG